MRILCNYTDCGPSYVRTGWKRVFEALGHQFYFWRCGQESAFDVFSKVEPDIYLGTTYELDRAVIKNIAKRPHMKVALYASAWGPYLKDVDLVKYPIVVASEDEKVRIEELKKATGKPDFVFIHAHDKWLDGTMSGWRKIGVDYIGVLNAADTFVYRNCERHNDLVCDIGFVGGYWGYKARNINKFLIPLCHPSEKLKVKVFGNQPWPIHQYFGRCSDKQAGSLFASATVCPNVSEPHSTDLGWDVIERPFKVLAAGGFCISDHVEEARDLFDANELLMFGNPKDFQDAVRWFINHPEERKPYMERGRAKVLAKHTYFDRVNDILKGLGMRDESSRLLKLKETMLA